MVIGLWSVARGLASVVLFFGSGSWCLRCGRPCARSGMGSRPKLDWRLMESGLKIDWRLMESGPIVKLVIDGIGPKVRWAV